MFIILFYYIPEQDETSLLKHVKVKLYLCLFVYNKLEELYYRRDFQSMHRNVNLKKTGTMKLNFPIREPTFFTSVITFKTCFFSQLFYN